MAQDLYNPDSIGQSWSSAGSIDGGGSNSSNFDWAAVGQYVAQYAANQLATKDSATVGGFNFNIETPKEKELRAELEARKEQQQTIFVIAILLIVGYLVFKGTK